MPEKQTLALEFLGRYPMQAARLLEQLPLENVAAFIQEMPAQAMNGIWPHMLPLHAARLLESVEIVHSSKALAPLKPETVAAILRHFSPDHVGQLMEKLPRRLAMLSRLLLDYAPSLVGAWMTPNVRSVPLSCSATEVRQRISASAFENYCPIYIVDDDNLLKGIVSPERLVAAKGDAPVASIMSTPGYSLPARSTLVSVANHPGWKYFDDLPVLDRARKFIGVLRYARLRIGLEDASGSLRNEQPSDLMMGFIEGSVFGVTDILNASLTPGLNESSRMTKEIDK